MYQFTFEPSQFCFRLCCSLGCLFLSQMARTTSSWDNSAFAVRHPAIYSNSDALRLFAACIRQKPQRGPGPTNPSPGRAPTVAGACSTLPHCSAHLVAKFNNPPSRARAILCGSPKDGSRFRWATLPSEPLSWESDNCPVHHSPAALWIHTQEGRFLRPAIQD